MRPAGLEGMRVLGVIACVGLVGCAEIRPEDTSLVTAEDWLRADRELLSGKKEAAEETVAPTEPVRPPPGEEAEEGWIMPPSALAAPAMPQLPPPDVEMHGAVPSEIPPARSPAAAPKKAEVKTAPSAETEAGPSPPPLLAAPKPSETASPKTATALPGELLSEPVPKGGTRTPDPAKITGMEPAAVQEILGAPALLRWEDHAQVYQYRGRSCVLDIVFYEPANGGPFQATHLSARRITGQDSDVASCLIDLLPASSWPESLLN